MIVERRSIILPILDPKPDPDVTRRSFKDQQGPLGSIALSESLAGEEYIIGPAKN
jgi:hypothetical protein